MLTPIVRTWATPDLDARGSIRRAIIGLSRIFCSPKPPPKSRRQRPDRPPGTCIPAGPAAPPTRAWPTALESVLSENTRRVYGAQWRIFTGWCGDVGLRYLPAGPLTVARYLAARAGDGASIATLRLATSAIAKAHEWAGHESPCRDQGVRASLKGGGRRLAKPQRQAGALTADVLAVIRLNAVQPRKRGRGFETPEQAGERARFDLALVAVLSDGGLEAFRGSRSDLGRRAALGRRQRPHHRGLIDDN